jgi:hypothetical protein
MTARERIDYLLDPKPSVLKLGLLLVKECTLTMADVPLEVL